MYAFYCLSSKTLQILSSATHLALKSLGGLQICMIPSLKDCVRIKAIVCIVLGVQLPPSKGLLLHMLFRNFSSQVCGVFPPFWGNLCCMKSERKAVGKVGHCLLVELLFSWSPSPRRTVLYFSPLHTLPLSALHPSSVTGEFLGACSSISAKENNRRLKGQAAVALASRSLPSLL